MDSANLGGRHEHEPMMRRCFELAKTALDQGNTPVGSLVVWNDQIVGVGVEGLPSGMEITGHAEIIACQQAVDRLRRTSLAGGVLYSTAEPCWMCSYAIRQAEISAVVYCLDTPAIGGVSSKHPILVDESIPSWKPAPQTTAGILKDEFLELKSSWNR